MREDISISKLLEMFKEYDLTPLERVILANEGTVQSLLSTLFLVPVDVEVISQIEESGVIIRWTTLVAEYSTETGVAACLAESIIPIEKNPKGFINGIREKKMGIGILLEGIGLHTVREILGIYTDDNVFSRTYRITGVAPNDFSVGADIIITEVFPKAVYKKVESL